MTVRVSPEPFTDDNPAQWNERILGPAWVETHTGDGARWFTLDVPVARGIRRFVRHALNMAPEDVTYGTVYAALLGGRPVMPGSWHYDLGEYREDGALRYVGTWSNDGVLLQNAYCLEGKATRKAIKPPNNHVVEFNEGTDWHRRERVPGRVNGWGVFVSLALYREDEPANLDCPRLTGLRARGPRAEQAMQHAEVERKVYNT